MSGRLRWPSTAAMPDGMRKLVETQHPTPAPTGKPTKPRNGKYNAEPVYIDSIRFDSKREGRYYEALKLRQAAGEIRHFHRQVLFDLEGGVIYRCDFQVIHADNTVEYVDAKGVETKEFKMKMRMVRARYGIEVTLV